MVAPTINPIPVGPLLLEPLKRVHFKTFVPLPDDEAPVLALGTRPDIDDHGWALTKEGRCLGFIMFGLDYPGSTLVSVFPSKELREKHWLTLGRILKRGLLHLNIEGHEKIEAEIDTDNRRNLRFIQRMGFIMHHFKNGAAVYRKVV